MNFYIDINNDFLFVFSLEFQNKLDIEKKPFLNSKINFSKNYFQIKLLIFFCKKYIFIKLFNLFKFMEKENINYLNEYENEIDIDNEINLLKKKINLVINERKKIEKETFIINNRINLMNKQEKDLQKSCILKKELIEKIINNRKNNLLNLKNKKNLKIQKEKELLNKKQQIQIQNRFQKELNNNDKYKNYSENNIQKELKENKENLKQKILELLAKQNNKNINNNILNFN